MRFIYHGGGSYVYGYVADVYGGGSCVMLVGQLFYEWCPYFMVVVHMFLPLIKVLWMRLVSSGGGSYVLGCGSCFMVVVYMFIDVVYICYGCVHYGMVVLRIWVRGLFCIVVAHCFIGLIHLSMGVFHILL